MTPAVLLALALALAQPTAPADPLPPLPGAAGERAPETRAFAYSAYEEETLAAALSALGLERDPAPEGKLVEEIRTVRLEVVEPRDPAPRIVNVAHVVTRARVIERELLLHPGEPFRQTLADESRRRLAAAPQLSVVLVVAARGSADDRTRVVVVTKDVWSLRLNWDAALTSSGLERFSVNPSETNFLGLHQTLGASFDLLPASYAAGLNYAAPRLLGTTLALGATAGLSFTRATGAREGSYASAELSRPLRSSRDAWSWSASATWLDEISRLYSGGEVVRFALDPAEDCARAPSRCLPFAWRTESVSASTSVTRSFGWAVKHDATLGLEARRSRYAIPDRAAFDPATVAAFEATRVPVSEDRVYPFARVRTYTSEFLRVVDLETLALQEDYRLGREASLTVYPVLRALGSSRDLLGITVGGAHTLALRDGLARGSVTVSNEVDRTGVADGSVQAGLRLASPRGALGRLVLDAVLVDRYENHLRRLSSLGGQDRLRGWPSGFLVGSRALAANLEARSRPLRLLESLQLAGALFWDAGDAFDRWRALDVHQSVGAGARFLFPQLDRTVFRVDVGFPLARSLPAGVSRAAFVATFGQAFSP